MADDCGDVAALFAGHPKVQKSADGDFFTLEPHTSICAGATRRTVRLAWYARSGLPMTICCWSPCR